MQERTCPVCGNTFKPTAANQRYCPPTADDRARRKGNAVSRCASRAHNHAVRTREGRQTRPLVAPLPAPFGCATCGTWCVPGENVASHAHRFCGYDCKAEWHRPRRAALVLVGRDTRAIAHWQEHCALHTIEQAFGPMRRRHELAYRKALRADPCAYCGGQGGALDHIAPQVDGGEDGWQNLTGACRLCNSTKGALSLLRALPWIPLATEYHAMRKLLYAKA